MVVVWTTRPVNRTLVSFVIALFSERSGVHKKTPRCVYVRISPEGAFESVDRRTVGSDIALVQQSHSEPFQYAY